MEYAFLKNMDKKKHPGIVFISIIFFLIFPLFPAFAQTNTEAPQAEGLTISPPMFELNLNPGEASRHTIRVTNPTKNLIELYPSSMDFAAAGEGGQPTFLTSGEESSRFSMANWITFETSKIALLPEQVVEFNFQINVPENPEPGGHYGVVFLATQPPKTEGQASQVALSSKVGSLLLIRIPGDIHEKASIEEFSAPWFYFSPPVNFTAFIRNGGNIHFKPNGEITIRDWRGKDLERIAVNPSKGNVLPDSRRKFELKWAAASQPFWKIPIGRFSANLRVAYGQSEQTLDSKIYFWIIPWWIIIAAGIIFLIVIILIFFRRRKKKKNRLEKEAAQSRQIPPALYPHPNKQINTPGQNSFYEQLNMPKNYPEENFKKEIAPENYISPKIPKETLPKKEIEKEKKIMRF